MSEIHSHAERLDNMQVHEPIVTSCDKRFAGNEKGPGLVCGSVTQLLPIESNAAVFQALLFSELHLNPPHFHLHAFAQTLNKKSHFPWYLQLRASLKFKAQQAFLCPPSKSGQSPVLILLSKLSLHFAWFPSYLPARGWAICDVPVIACPSSSLCSSTVMNFRWICECGEGAVITLMSVIRPFFQFPANVMLIPLKTGVLSAH